jgi:hypothetical protein
MTTNDNGTNGNGNEEQGAGELLAEGQAMLDAGVKGITGNVSGSGPSPESEPGSVVAGEVAPPPAKLTKADFVSGQEVRWCPGCGDCRDRKCAGVRAAATTPS